jgi:hypothetical protein
MAYAVTNPPQVLVPGIGSKPTMWSYSSTDDDATVNGSGYFTNGKSLGMKLGDSVYVWDSTTPKGSQHYVSVVNATTGAVTTAFAAVA